MLKRIKYDLWPKDFNFALGIEEVVKTIKTEFNIIPTRFGFRNADSTFNIYIDNNQSVRFESLKKFLRYFKTLREFESFSCNIAFTKLISFGLVVEGIWIEYSKSNIEVTCHAGDTYFVERAIEIVQGILKLSIVARYDSDEYRWKYLDPTIFISRHFDALADKYYSEISSFLSLLGFSVNQGEEYTASLIPEKVKHRMDQQDIIIVIVSGNRNHDWLISEIGYAIGKQKHIIILKEKSAIMNTTILGKDYEYIEFDDNYIQLSYSKLLREFRSVRIKGLF